MKKNACNCVEVIDVSIDEIKKLMGEEQVRGLTTAWENLRGDLVKLFNNKPKKQKKPRGGKQALGKKLAKVVPAVKKAFDKAGKSVKPVAEELPLKKGDTFKTPDGRTYRYSGNGVAKPQKQADKVKSPKKAEAKKQQGVSEYGMGVEAFKKLQASAKSYRIEDHEVSLNLGGFPVRALAERDAKELLTHPKIFWYRQTMFPDPKAAKVQPTIVTATVSERSSAKFTRAPYTVFTVIRIDGDVKNCRAWAEGVVSKNKGDQE